MEIFALAVQERQQLWKNREKFSKWEQLAEDSAELSTYLTSVSAKRRRQAFTNRIFPRIQSALTEVQPPAAAATQSHAHSGDSGGSGGSNSSGSRRDTLLPHFCSADLDQGGPGLGSKSSVLKINGVHQSPINLTSSDAVHDPRLLDHPLTDHYQLTRDFELINTGYVLQLSLRPKPLSTTVSDHNLSDWQFNNGTSSPKPDFLNGTESVLTGGPLEPDCSFQLIDIIFHWGKELDRGSEHTINFKAYPMEIQFVHWNCSRFSSYEEALGKEHGIAVSSLFVQIGREHPTIKMVIDHIEEVQFRAETARKGRSKRITTVLNPSSLLPDPALRDYWYYIGSLTIPPCHENVIWILYRYPLTISHAQLEEFRRLKTFTRGESPTAGYEGQMVDNFRPTQALSDRTIYSSFKL